MNESNENTPKKKGRLSTIVLIVASVVFVVCAVIIAVKLVSYHKANSANKKLAENVVSEATKSDDEATDNTDIPAPSLDVDFEGLFKESANAVGWVHVPSVSISYPVVQGEDNDFYMDHMFNDEFSWSGSIFLDYMNQSIEDLHTILYGHHMQDGSMFTGLLEYDSEDFFKEQKESNNHYFYIYTEKATYTYEIFCVTDVTFAENPEAYNIVINNKDGLIHYLDVIEPLALYDTGITADENDTIATLYTCQSDSSSKVRHLVHGKLVATQTK